MYRALGEAWSCSVLGLDGEGEREGGSDPGEKLDGGCGNAGGGVYSG